MICGDQRVCPLQICLMSFHLQICLMSFHLQIFTGGYTFEFSIIQRIFTYSGSISVRLTSCLDRLDLTKKVNLLLLFNISKAAESKKVKQEVSLTVILLL